MAMYRTKDNEWENRMHTRLNAAEQAFLLGHFAAAFKQADSILQEYLLLSTGPKRLDIDERPPQPGCLLQACLILCVQALVEQGRWYDVDDYVMKYYSCLSKMPYELFALWCLVHSSNGNYEHVSKTCALMLKKMQYRMTAEEYEDIVELLIYRGLVPQLQLEAATEFIKANKKLSVAKKNMILLDLMTLTPDKIYGSKDRANAAIQALSQGSQALVSTANNAQVAHPNQEGSGSSYTSSIPTSAGTSSSSSSATPETLNAAVPNARPPPQSGAQPAHVRQQPPLPRWLAEPWPYVEISGADATSTSSGSTASSESSPMKGDVTLITKAVTPLRRLISVCFRFARLTLSRLYLTRPGQYVWRHRYTIFWTTVFVLLMRSFMVSGRNSLLMRMLLSPPFQVLFENLKSIFFVMFSVGLGGRY